MASVEAAWWFLNRVDFVACIDAVYPLEVFKPLHEVGTIQASRKKLKGVRRKRRMKFFAAQAKDYDKRRLDTWRDESAARWRELATAAEVKRAPKYLAGPGR